MRISQGIIRQASVDEENLILLERVAECYARCMDLYSEIAILLPERNGSSYITVLGFRNEEGTLSFFEGDILQEDQQLLAREAVESIQKTQGTDGSLFIPFCRNHRGPYGLIRLSPLKAPPMELLHGDSRRLFTRHLQSLGRKARLSPGLLAEPTVFLQQDEVLVDLNNSCQDFRTYFNLGEGWLEEFLGTGLGKASLQEIKEDSLCHGLDLEVDGFSFLVTACPVIVDNFREGTLIMVSDTTEVREMQQEVINKSTVIREIHHRVKNNLQTIASLLRLQSRRSGNSSVEKALLESINRISSIALIHETLSKEGKNTVNIMDCVKGIMSMVLSNMQEPGKTIRGELQGQEIYLNSSQASSISLCITELIQNAVEHAFVIRKKGNVLVTIEQVGSEVIITVEDDGVGFQGHKAKGNSLGLQIIEMITAENLKGTFRLDGHAYGSKAEIRFPL